MPARIVTIGLLFGAIGALSVGNAQQLELQNLCAQNPACTAAPDGVGGVVMKLRAEGRTIVVRCGPDGLCLRISARGKPMPNTDLALLLTAS